MTLSAPEAGKHAKRPDQSRVEDKKAALWGGLEVWEETPEEEPQQRGNARGIPWTRRKLDPDWLIYG